MAILLDALNLQEAELEAMGIQPDGRVTDRFTDVEIETAEGLAAEVLADSAEQA